MQADPLSGARWHQVSELIAARTGLHFPLERHPDLRRALDEAASELGCRDGEDCADRLLSSALSREELRVLARHLTIGETYFFRERPSFNALATHVMPLLIHHQRAGNRRLRLWSAACSTGEETWSLAMLVQQVLPDWRDWNVSILGTDLNPHSLRKAEAGIYGEWSFRDCPPDLRERFFIPVGDRRHRVRSELRDLVRFAELNLAQDVFPSLSNDTNAMDLILCRNLLIYFTPAHARRLIGNLRQSLVDDGWLIVSPAECSQDLFGGFAPVNFPGSVLYRKRHPAVVANAPEPAFSPATPLTELQVSEMLAPAELQAPAREPTDAATESITTNAEAAPALPDSPAESAREPTDAQLAVAERAYACGQYAEAVATLRAALDSRPAEPVKLRALGMLTRALANQGLLDEALRASERWIAADKLDAAAHYLHAMVLQELGDRGRARAALQSAIYLQPEFTLAHFALGHHARAEARVNEARRHFANAARLLEGLPADTPILESEGLTAARLREIIVSLDMDT